MSKMLAIDESLLKEVLTALSLGSSALKEFGSVVADSLDGAMHDLREGMKEQKKYDVLEWHDYSKEKPHPTYNFRYFVKTDSGKIYDLVCKEDGNFNVKNVVLWTDYLTKRNFDNGIS